MSKIVKNKLTKVKEINNKSKKNLDDVSERLEKDIDYLNTFNNMDTVFVDNQKLNGGCGIKYETLKFNK